jgi:hypothetical protein
MSEKAAVRTLVSKLANTTTHLQRIEDALSTGIPDLNFCFDSIEVWIEVKYLAKLPVKRLTPVKIGLKQPQALWLSKRNRCGGNAFIVVRCAFDNTWRLIANEFYSYVDGIDVETFQYIYGYATVDNLISDIKRFSGGKCC